MAEYHHLSTIGIIEITLHCLVQVRNVQITTMHSVGTIDRAVVSISSRHECYAGSLPLLGSQLSASDGAAT